MQKTIAVLLLFGCLRAHTQNVGMGTNAPASSAQLDVSSTTKGMLIPRMTTTQRNAIANPVVGLQVFNLDDQCTDIYDGANWIKNCGLKVTSIVTEPGHPTPNSWTRKNNFGGAERMNAVAFSIGDKAYLGTGSGAQLLKDFWEYNSTTDTWSQKADVGGKERSGASGFAIGNKGYIGLGAWSGIAQNDFWEYDPFTNTWTKKADFGGAARYSAVGFSIGSKGYIGTGFYKGNLLKDFWEYDPLLDIWTQKTDFGGTPRRDAVGFSIGSKGYLGTGIEIANTARNDFWQFDPASNTWVMMANFAGAPRAFAVGFAIGNKGYISTGGSNANDFWEYDPITNAWVQKADFGGTPRTYAVGFSIGKKGYIGTGYTKVGYGTNDLWEYVDNNAYTTYTANGISTENNTISNGAWTLANSTLSNANSGNVGIGTTSPVAKLQVSGSGATTLRLDAPANSNAFSMGGSGSFNIDAAGIPGGRLVVKDDGKIGIGTNAPAASLDVAGTLNASAWKTQSATPNGYANMGGVLMQWGTVSYNSNEVQTINFPVGFTEVFSVTLTPDNNNNTTSPGSNVPAKLVAVGNTSFKLGGTQVFSNDNSCKIRWIAIGR